MSELVRRVRVTRLLSFMVGAALLLALGCASQSEPEAEAPAPAPAPAATTAAPLLPPLSPQRLRPLLLPRHLSSLKGSW